MNKKTILFVDDEPNILSGLKRMLRSLRGEMTFHFVESGTEALQLLETTHVDVIISDMRMPGMDGATLLKEVQSRHPQVMRMILSGHADRSAILETVGVAHQFLAKPTSADVLRQVISRACQLQDMFNNNALKALITRVGTLPSVPKIYMELEEKMKDVDCDIDEVGTIISKDMAMSTKVLQLVNSAFFGLYKNVESPAKAVKLLGLDTVRMLVLSIGVFAELSGDENTEKIQELWKHSYGVALFAKHIAELEGLSKDEINNAFIAGLLHDIGKLLLFTSEKELYTEVYEKAESNAQTCWLTEQQILHSDHAEAGGFLIGLWGLPGSVVEGVAFHHRLKDYPSPSFSPALAVHAADIIYQQIHPDPDFIPPTPQLDYFAKAGFEGRFQQWQQECLQLIKDINL